MTNQSGETVYNTEMPELIFGKFSAQEWFPSGRDESKGIYRAARTVRVGPYKLMSLSFIIGQAEQDALWAVGIRGGCHICVDVCGSSRAWNCYDRAHRIWDRCSPQNKAHKKTEVLSLGSCDRVGNHGGQHRLLESVYVVADIAYTVSALSAAFTR